MPSATRRSRPRKWASCSPKRGEARPVGPHLRVLQPQCREAARAPGAAGRRTSRRQRDARLRAFGRDPRHRTLEFSILPDRPHHRPAAVSSELVDTHTAAIRTHTATIRAKKGHPSAGAQPRDRSTSSLKARNHGCLGYPAIRKARAIFTRGQSFPARANATISVSLRPNLWEFVTPV
jgi:hypothetical protein